jgi:3-oxoacyl-[acyl-carrier-protein] synthase-1
MHARILSITSTTLTCALGTGNSACQTALKTQTGGLRKCDFDETTIETWIGRVNNIDLVTLPTHLKPYDCRNNRLAILGLEQDSFTSQLARCRVEYGAERVGLFIGTSTSGIHQAELAFRTRDNNTGRLPDDFNLQKTVLIHSAVDFLRDLLEIKGPSIAISTACSSSAKVFAAASRYMRAGICDVAIVGGVDSLCLSTLYGFNALQLISPSPCRPWDANRNGINIGEAAGYALLEWDKTDVSNIALLGYGESSDAYHISTPHPEGKGAALAMTKALLMAGLAGDEVDYLNLHGTATLSNDASEDAALRSVFGQVPPFSSTKGWTGHTLGAAGITEAIIACYAIESDIVPGTLNTKNPDIALSEGILLENRNMPVRNVLSNSFGFGGSNCSLVIGEACS